MKQIDKYFNLKDDCLSYQFIPCRGTNIEFTSIYQGSKYDDSCLAEINYLYKNKWLFGDINE